METLSDHVLPPAPSGGQVSDTEQPRPSPEAAAEVPGEHGRGLQEGRGGQGDTGLHWVRNGLHLESYQ